MADGSFHHWLKTWPSTCSRIMCLQHTQNLFKQSWGGPNGTQAIALTGLSDRYIQLCCQETALIFLPSFLVSVSARSSLPVSIFCCALWFRLAKPLPQLWLPWTCSAYVFATEHSVLQGWKYALAPLFVSGCWWLMAPRVSSWSCQVKIHWATMYSCTVSYQTFWFMTYIRQITWIFLHNNIWRKHAQKKDVARKRSLYPHFTGRKTKVPWSLSLDIAVRWLSCKYSSKKRWRGITKFLLRTSRACC